MGRTLHPTSLRQAPRQHQAPRRHQAPRLRPPGRSARPRAVAASASARKAAGRLLLRCLLRSRRHRRPGQRRQALPNRPPSDDDAPRRSRQSRLPRPPPLRPQTRGRLPHQRRPSYAAQPAQRNQPARPRPAPKPPLLLRSRTSRSTRPLTRRPAHGDAEPCSGASPRKQRIRRHSRPLLPLPKRLRSHRGQSERHQRGESERRQRRQPPVQRRLSQRQRLTRRLTQRLRPWQRREHPPRAGRVRSGRLRSATPRRRPCSPRRRSRSSSRRRHTPSQLPHAPVCGHHRAAPSRRTSRRLPRSPASESGNPVRRHQGRRPTGGPGRERRRRSHGR